MALQEWFCSFGSNELTVYLIFKKAVKFSNSELIEQVLRVFNAEKASSSLKANLLSSANIHDNNGKSVVIDIADSNDHFAKYLFSCRMNG